MAENADLHGAKMAKKDEFYTELTDIEKEMRHYRKHFAGKTVLCNCDDPFESNFFKYFVLNFNRLGLKKLLATCYAGSPIAGGELSLFDIFGEEEKPKNTPYKAVVTKVCDTTGNGGVDMMDVAELFKRRENELSELTGDGDFRSEECLALLDEADIVITNPPFSLFREYVATLMEHEKKFIIIGNVNAITYKEFFPLIRDNRVWIGASIHSGDRKFYVPDDYPLNASGCGIDENGRRFIRVKGVRWYTNLDIKQRHEDLILVKKYAGHEDEYPRYDNYDAINVDKVSDIPYDYDGVMGVPITFLDKYNPDQFELVAFRKGEDGKDLVFTREREFNRTFVSLCDSDPGNDQERRRKDQWENYLRKNHNHAQKEPVEVIFPLATNLANGLVNDCRIHGAKTYVRMLIRNKHPEPTKEG